MSRLTPNAEALQQLCEDAAAGIAPSVTEPQGPFANEKEQSLYELLVVIRKIVSGGRLVLHLAGLGNGRRVQTFVVPQGCAVTAVFWEETNGVSDGTVFIYTDNEAGNTMYCTPVYAASYGQGVHPSQTPIKGLFAPLAGRIFCVTAGGDVLVNIDLVFEKIR